jgi:hypothetical protein
LCLTRDAARRDSCPKNKPYLTGGDVM